MNPSLIPTTGYQPYIPYNAAGNDALDKAQTTLSAPAQTSQSVPQSHKGNWFTHLLPTIGSIAAPVIGGLLAPETGGLSLLAGLALAGGGSAAGKVAENAVQGDQQNIGNILDSAAEGAGGQLVGAGIGKVLGGVASKGTSALSKAVEDRGAQVAAEDASKAATDEAARVGHEFGAIKPGQAQVGPAIEDLKNLGIQQPTAQDMLNVGSTYTGSNPETGTGVINFYKQQALDQAGGNVNLDKTMNDLNATLTHPENKVLGGIEPVSSSRGQLPKTPSNTATGIVEQVRGMLPAGSLDKSGQISTSLSPHDAFQLLKNVGNKISQTTPKPNALGVLDESKVAENNVWKSVYGSIKNSLYNRPEVDSAVAGIKVGPDHAAVIDDALKANGINDPTVAANIKSHLTDVLNNSTTAQDLLNAERPMVNVSRVGKIANEDAINNPQIPRNVRSNKAAALPGSTSEPNNNMLDTAALVGAPFTGGASLLGLLPSAVKAAKDPAKQEIVDKLVKSGVSRKIASAIPPALTGASQFITHASDSTPNPVNLNLGSNDMNQQTPGQDPNSLNSLLLQLAIANAANPNTQGTASTLLNNVLPQVQNTNVAQQSLLGTENAFQQAGGGQGGVMGNLSKVLGHITGGPASQYEQQRQQLVSQLTPLGIPTTAVPDITGNNQSATNQFQTLQDMIRAKLNGGSISAIPIQ